MDKEFYINLTTAMEAKRVSGLKKVVGYQLRPLVQVLKPSPDGSQ